MTLIKIIGWLLLSACQRLIECSSTPSELLGLSHGNEENETQTGALKAADAAPVKFAT
jgi:hypothetical protein